jgi:hypothetical protein
MIISVIQGAMAESAGETRRLALQSPIFVGDVVKTDVTGSVQILFDDDSILAVAEDGEVVINHFVYSGSGNAASGTTSFADTAATDDSSSASVSAAGDATGSSSVSATSVGPAGGQSDDGAGASLSSGAGNLSASALGEGVDVSGSASGSAVTSTGGMGTTAANNGAGESSASALGGGNGVSGVASSSVAASTGGTGTVAANVNGDGISIGVNQGTAVFASGSACRNGCDVESFGGIAGIGGTDTLAARTARDNAGRSTNGAGVLLTVTASGRDRTSVISAVAVSQDMQVAVTGTGLAAQALPQQGSVKLGGGAAAVGALDARSLQTQMNTIASASTVMPSGLLAATAPMAALTTNTGVKTLAAGGISSLGGALTPPQAKAVGAAQSSLAANMALGEVASGINATLTRRDDSSTIDFTSNKLLQYDSASIVTYTNGGNTSEIQTNLALQNAVSLSQNVNLAPQNPIQNVNLAPQNPIQNVDLAPQNPIQNVNLAPQNPIQNVIQKEISSGAIKSESSIIDKTGTSAISDVGLKNQLLDINKNPNRGVIGGAIRTK